MPGSRDCAAGMAPCLARRLSVVPFVFFVTFVVFVFFVAPSFVAGAQGTQPPKRIISLVPALTEILFAIGAGPQIVAVSSFDDDPPEVKTLPRVGALLDPDTERILSLRPDLVLIYGSQADLEKQLATGGIKTFAYRHGGLSDLAPAFRTLGSLTGHAAEAEKVVTELERRFADIRARVAGRPRPKVLLVIGHDPESLRHLDASGGLGFLNDLIEMAGGQNVFADVRQQALRVSMEMLIARAPDIILDLHYAREVNAAQQRTDLDAWRLASSVPAVKTGRVQLLFGDEMVVPGPRIGAAAEVYARAIHPEVFSNARE